MTGADGGHDYRVVASSAPFTGAVVRVRVDEVEMPGGDVATREVVAHPGAVAVVALDDSGRIALVRQFRHPARARLWELPAGLLDVPGESRRAAAERELAEETGLAAQAWREVTTLLPSPGFSEERVTVFLATGIRDIGRTERPHEEAELEVRRVPLDEACREIREGGIVNGIAIAGILAAKLVLDAG